MPWALHTRMKGHQKQLAGVKSMAPPSGTTCTPSALYMLKGQTWSGETQRRARVCVTTQGNAPGHWLGSLFALTRVPLSSHRDAPRFTTRVR